MTIAIRSGSDSGPVTIADVNLKFIWDVVSRIKIGDKGKAYVVDGNGFLIADPDIGLVLRKTNLANLAHVKAAAEKQKAQEPAMFSTDLGGTQVLTSVASIEPLDWKVFVEQPVAEVYAKLNASIVRTALLLLAGLVISAVGALALARGMVRPIRTLDEGARRIGAGELDQNIEIHTGDELEGLADQFNRMSGQLRESYAGLERKVDERTRELTNSLEQQTAISEILRVISASPTDVRPVLQTVAERAAHLCDAPFAFVVLVEGNELRPAASYSAHDAGSGYEDPAKLEGPFPLKRTYVIGRAALDRATIHLPDVLPLIDTEYPDVRPVQKRFGFRAMLVVPLMREAGAYGVILLWRREAKAFSLRSDRTAADLCAASGDRHRQRPPFQRNQGGARPADRDQRNPPRHLELAYRCAARPRGDCRTCGAAMRRLGGVDVSDRRQHAEAARLEGPHRRIRYRTSKHCRSMAVRCPVAPFSNGGPSR